MAEYTIFTDFNSLNRNNAGDWVANCSVFANEAFRNSSKMGNLLYLNSILTHKNKA